MLKPHEVERFPAHEALGRAVGRHDVVPELADAAAQSFPSFAGARGYPVHVLGLQAANEVKPGGCALVLDAQGHAVGIVRSSSGRLMLERAGEAGARETTLEGLREWLALGPAAPIPLAYVGERRDGDAHGTVGHHDKRAKHDETLGDALRALVRLERDEVMRALVFGAGAGVVGLAGPIASQGVVTAVSFGTLQQPLLVIAGLLFAVLALSALLSFAQQVVVEMLTRRLFVRTALDLDERLRSVAHEPPSAHEQAYVHEVFALQKAASTLLVDGASTMLKLALGLGLLAFYHPYLLAFDVLSITAIIAVVVVPMKRAWSLSLEVSGHKYAAIHALDARAHGDHSHGDASIAGYLESWLDSRARYWRSLQLHNVGALVVGVLMVSGLLLFGGLLVLRGELTLGQLVAAELVVGDAAFGAAKIGKLLATLYDAAVSATKLRKLVGRRDERGSDLDTRERVRLLPVRTPRAWQTFSRLVVAGFALFVVVCAFVPWQQTAMGRGRVIAFAPEERTQEISAPVDGRVLRWDAVEGQRLKAGDVVAVLGDNDPEILERLGAEADAQRARVAAGRARIMAIDERIVALTSSREAAMSAAEHRATMALERVRSVEQSLEAARASARTALMQEERQVLLFSEGLASKRAVELAELDRARTGSESVRAEVSLSLARRDAKAIDADRERVEHDTLAALNDVKGQLEVARGDVASSAAELARVESRLARQDNLVVKAPLDGTLHRVVPRGIADFVKAGETLATIVPDTQERAVELLIDGNDVPLVHRAEDVRLQFEGWPAIQFSGWPSTAVGTFGGKVRFVDATDDGSGRFRVVIVPSEQWPEGAYLRQGARAQGWVLLNRVSVGYELWRQFNGFPPTLPAEGKTSTSKDASGKGSGK